MRDTEASLGITEAESLLNELAERYRKPEYDPAIDITVNDWAKRMHLTGTCARAQLDELVRAGTLTKHFASRPGTVPVMAYRRVSPAD